MPNHRAKHVDVGSPSFLPQTEPRQQYIVTSAMLQVSPTARQVDRHVPGLAFPSALSAQTFDPQQSSLS
jgi:hypothetical protein